MSPSRSVVAVVAALCALCAGAPAADPRAGPPHAPLEQPAWHQPIYVGTGGGSYKNLVDANTWFRPGTDGPIAVGSADLRAMGLKPGDAGLGYFLNGMPTGFTYVNNTGLSVFLDGTTDSVNFNYSVRTDNGDLWRFDRDWQNGVAIFGTDPQTAGVAFDLSTNTIWTNRGIGVHEVRQYDLAGNLVFAFAYNVGEDTSALAYDPHHDELFICSLAGSTVYRFTKSGLLIDSVDSGVTGIQTAECILPAPGAAALLAVAGLMARRRR